MDSVRASRDGHEFHEAWAARMALRLVMNSDGLVGMAVEGPAPKDQAAASPQEVEIADLVLYYGGRRPDFRSAKSVSIVQLKYSKSNESTPFRVRDSTKTVLKFANAYRARKRDFGLATVHRKLDFSIVTNRPVLTALTDAIQHLANGTTPTGDARKQATQFAKASKLKGLELRQFASRFSVSGLAGSLARNKRHASRLVASWSIASDALARARLGALRQLVRDKAGLAGQGRNLISRVDVLDALDVQNPEELLPCPAAFPDVGTMVVREQLQAALDKIPLLERPLLIHADGGVGKTVFLQSISADLSERHEAILFDCFGGGTYRAPEDSRHLPHKGLVHIVNSLACKGLCDPFLPGSATNEDFMRAFRARIGQAVTTLRKRDKGVHVVLIIDAIDNAADQAKHKGEVAFPRLLLESVHHGGPIEGMKLVVSCRTHRRDLAKGDIPCDELELNPFTPSETTAYLRARVSGLTPTQIKVAQARSGGNARVLEHLAISDRGLLDPSEIAKVIILKDLLRARITDALAKADKRGSREGESKAFLAGLSVLPPPVPIEEYAAAHGIDVGAARSFTSDLSDLLEQTGHGVRFRDEPTETLLKEEYGASEVVLRQLADNLLRQQSSSVYAAHALPSLLERLGDSQLLFSLAFHDAYPDAITSVVGRRNIRYARLKAAVLHASRLADFDRLIHLIVELSTIAATNQRGKDYILKYPDLVVASKDVDATRRLYEVRTRWPGTRHARLAIASVLAGDLSNGTRHAVQLEEWMRHFYALSDEEQTDRGGPSRQDIAALHLCMIASDRGREAAAFLKRWPIGYAYEVAERLFCLLRLAVRNGVLKQSQVDSFLGAIGGHAGLTCAAIPFVEFDDTYRSKLITDLAGSVGKRPKQLAIQRGYGSDYDGSLIASLLRATAIAIGIASHMDAKRLLAINPVERPLLYAFAERYSTEDVFPFVAYATMEAIVANRDVDDKSLLPRELVEIACSISTTSGGREFRMELQTAIADRVKQESTLPKDKRKLSEGLRSESDRYLEDRAAGVGELAKALRRLIVAKGNGQSEAFVALIDVWQKLRGHRDRYSDHKGPHIFFNVLGVRALLFALRIAPSLSVKAVKTLTSHLVSKDSDVFAPTLIDFVAVVSARPALHEQAGQIAVRTRELIEKDDDVDSRSSLFAKLSRSVLSASSSEASSYFRLGLEQMDAIGSGDYQFTGELLDFASELQGDELDISDVHTLANLCELNMSSEAEKFPWSAYGAALSRVSGIRGLARLCRWQDRDKVSLDYSLLPYLRALISQGKIDPQLALAIMRVSESVELRSCGTVHLAESLYQAHRSDFKQLFAELLDQFHRNNPGVTMAGRQGELAEIARRPPSSDTKLAAELSAAAHRFEALIHEDNEQRNFGSSRDRYAPRLEDDSGSKDTALIDGLCRSTNPINLDSLSNAVEAIDSHRNSFELKRVLFERLTESLPLDARPEYIRTISKLNNLDIYAKLREFRRVRELWSATSVAAMEAFREVAIPVITANAEDFVSHDYVSGSQLRELSELTGAPIPDLALILVKLLASPDVHISASVWMGLASLVSSRTKPGEGQDALRRLLRSGASALAATVTEGAWRESLYPADDQIEVSSGIIWFSLGSPNAATRWRAAHSIQTLATFGRWDVVAAIVQRYATVTASPYQAPELSFFHMHARLWLLIALARVALDFPTPIAAHAERLKAVSFDDDNPHVLLRHFASRALLTCVEAGTLQLRSDEAARLRTLDQSPFGVRVSDQYERGSPYDSRPPSHPEPKDVFRIEHDFGNTEVSSLSRKFGRSYWETADRMSAWVRSFDKDTTGMYDKGGREESYRKQTRGMDDFCHRYGEYLGWHALYVVSGQYLAKYPAVRQKYDEQQYDPWRDWLEGELLTRKDGLWLSDGTDRTPLNAQVNLKEVQDDAVALTGDKSKVLDLLAIGPIIGDEIVVAGGWKSYDDISIHISSALVPPKHAKKEALRLSRIDPFQAWLPQFEAHEDGEDYISSNGGLFKPWISLSSREMKLDRTDPLAPRPVAARLRLSHKLNALLSLGTTDPFRRVWKDPAGAELVTSQAWGEGMKHSEDDPVSGGRLLVRRQLIRDVLEKTKSELVLLVVLRRYEKGYGDQKSRFYHSTAVVHVRPSLEYDYHPGAVNRLHESQF